MKLRTYAAATGMALLAACSDSSGSSGSSNGGAVSYSDLQERGEALNAAAAALAETSIMPTTGTATYEGTANLRALMDEGNSTEGINGALTMKADFAKQTIEGSIESLVGENLQSGKSNVSIIDGQINGNVLTADLKGSVEVPGEGTDIITGSMSGNFRGANAEMISGDITGQFDDGTGDPTGFKGTFAGESQ